MPSVLGDHLMMAMDGIGACDAKIEFLIFCAVELRAKPPDAEQNVSPEHHGDRRPDEIQTQQCAVVIRLRSASMDVPGPLRAEPSVIAANKGGVGMSLKGAKTGF